jgi:hypothetical protein
MAFDANRDIKIEGSQGADGLFTLRTKGLADRKRPELEMTGLPEAALRAAGGVINKVAEYSVNQAEVLADQNIALFLPRDDEDEDEDEAPVMLALHTVEAEAPKGGFFARLGGGGKGVLRLVDIVGEKNGPPLTAIATMLVYRASVRRESGDLEGAREELDAAIEIFPGEENAGAAPVIGDGTAIFNWQNHLAYLALAENDDDDGAPFYRQALARSDTFAIAELSAPLRDLAGIDPEELEAIAEGIVAHNLAGDSRVDIPVPSPAHAVLVSPLWQRVEDGKIGRYASLVPAGFRELYYEGAAAEGLRRAGARLAANAVRDALADPARLAWMIRDIREVWVDDHAPVSETIGDAHPAHGLLSSVLVFAGRFFRAGASEEQIAGALRGKTDDALHALLGAHGEWEGAQYASALLDAEDD